MKKALLTIIGVFTLFTITFAQADKDLKSAEKILNKFYQNPSDGTKLATAIPLLESALSSDDIKAKASAWITKGNILSELANSEFKLKTLDPSYVLSNPTAAIEAFKAFEMASSLAEKKGDIKDAFNGISDTENHLNNAAIFAYQDKDYANAFKFFEGTLAAADLLKKAKKATRLDDMTAYNEQLFFTAVSGYYGNDLKGSKPYFEKLLTIEDSTEPLIYEALYRIATTEEDPEAVKYLEMGREKFPDDTGILFQEINHYLTAGKLTELIGKLETAIEKEPENITVHTTLGNVFDQLSVQEAEAGNTAKSQEYFEKAMGKYKDGLAIDETNFDATYSLGALYYNKAATKVEELNGLNDDISAAGLKKYDAKKSEMDGLFNEALPYFQKAEQLKGDDINTIIALKEIYARLNQLDKSGEYKVKYETLSAGN